MSVSEESLCEAVVEYLMSEFADCEIQQEHQEDSLGFRILCEDQGYFLSVMRNAIVSVEAAQIAEYFASFSVVMTLKSLGDFPVVLTESGCIFGSP